MASSKIKSFINYLLSWQKNYARVNVQAGQVFVSGQLATMNLIYYIPYPYVPLAIPLSERDDIFSYHIAKP